MEAPDEFKFPFEPYPIQHEFMKVLYEVIENKKLGIFESPTGTGKSLSIICGAVQWLKDHKNYEKNHLETKINTLELQKQQIGSNSIDWLTTQSQEIELMRQINELKIKQNKLNDYEKKIENLRKKKSTIQRKWKSNSELIIEKESDEDEDMILFDNSLEENEEDCHEKVDNKYIPTKIFICSRTHSQLSQFVGEILKSPFAKDLRVVSLASRQNYCINPNVNKLKSNSLINERCLDKQKQSANKSTKDEDGKVLKKQKGVNSRCPYYKQSAIGDLKDLTLTEVLDMEDLVKNGKKLNACPYYSSRLAAEDAEVVLVPYNTILCKPTREANGISLEGNVIIIDEAHNLLEAMAQMHSSELSYGQIQQGLLQLKCYKQRFNTRFSAANLLNINQLIFVMTKLQKFLDQAKTDTFNIENFVLSAKIDNYNMFKLLKFCRENRLIQKVRSYALKYPLDNKILEKPSKKSVKDFLSSIENKKDAKNDNNVENVSFVLSNPLLAIISFLECLTYSYNDGRIFIQHDSDKSKTKLQFLLLNPSQNFKEIVKAARSVIVAGGTMKPYKEFKNRLFMNSGVSPERIVQFTCNHIIPPENILPIIITEGPNKEKLLFNYENKMSMGNTIKCLIQEACKVVRGGIVMFFPSYSYENWIWQQIKDLSFGRPVFRESQDTVSVDTILKFYADAIAKSSNSGALLLSVVGGKLSEGLNFSDDLGRCIIVVGLPYANIMAPDLKEKMTYLDKTEGPGAGNFFYEGLCMKAVNQSIGRAVRHKDDYATILLLDERYNRMSIKNALPDWIKRSLKVHNFENAFLNMQKFFEIKRNNK